jgi:hypothetical protein
VREDAALAGNGRRCDQSTLAAPPEVAANVVKKGWGGPLGPSLRRIGVSQKFPHPSNKIAHHAIAKAPPWSRRCLRRRLLRQRQTGGQSEAGLPRGFERAPGQASPWRKRLGIALRCCCSSRDGTGRAPARVLEHGAAELLARLTQGGVVALALAIFLRAARRTARLLSITWTPSRW